MKLVSLASFAVTLALSVEAPFAAPFLPVFFGAMFAAYGIAMSFSKRIDPLNDVPNAFRVFLASLGGYLVTLTQAYVFPSAGVLLLVSALCLNDEFQRRALEALRNGKRGGSVALLGIDGSGKSSHAPFIGRWLEARGYATTVFPFHRYLFVERLASVSAGVRGGGARTARSFEFKRGGNPLRPILSLVDNILLQLLSSAGCRLEGRIVVYDRFIWSTFVKYKALGYPIGAVSRFYLSPRPTLAIVLDIPPERSLEVIDERVTHIHYPRQVLQFEREQYLEMARRRGYPVINATAPFREVQDQIEARLERLFPAAARGGPKG